MLQGAIQGICQMQVNLGGRRRRLQRSPRIFPRGRGVLWRICWHFTIEHHGDLWEQNMGIFHMGR